MHRRCLRPPEGLGTNHTPSIAFRHLPPNSARTGYATEWSSTTEDTWNKTARAGPTPRPMTAMLPAPKSHICPSDGNQVTAGRIKTIIAGRIKTITDFNKTCTLSQKEKEKRKTRKEKRLFRGSQLNKL